MNLKNITDSELIKKTENLVRTERETLTVLLHHLREVQRRRLFSTLKYKSLFDFTVRHLKYPKDQAYRRIAAMKLLNELPEVEEKINSGAISLTHIGLAQSFFRQEEKFTDKELTTDQKNEVFEMIAGKSVRDAERITLALASNPVEIKPDRVKAVSANRIEVKFTATCEVENKIETLKGLLAHKFPSLTIGELFDKLCDLGIEAWDPAAKAKFAAPRKTSTERKKISQAEIRRNIFRKAQNKCENCGSTYALEIDHCEPKALGGDSTKENLRLLCRSCNQRAAIKAYGIIKMERYLDGS